MAARSKQHHYVRLADGRLAEVLPGVFSDPPAWSDKWYLWPDLERLARVIYEEYGKEIDPAELVSPGCLTGGYGKYISAKLREYGLSSEEIDELLTL